jgi:hypothetical protein
MKTSKYFYYLLHTFMYLEKQFILLHYALKIRITEKFEIDKDRNKLIVCFINL